MVDGISPCASARRRQSSNQPSGGEARGGGGSDDPCRRARDEAYKRRRIRSHRRRDGKRHSTGERPAPRGGEVPSPEPDMGDASVGPVLSHAQARKTQIGADIAQLQLDELKGLLVRVADIDAGAAMQGETLARRIDQMLPEWADELAAVVAKDGTAGLRAALKGKARELRGALAEAFAALASTPAHEDGNVVELEAEAAA